MNRKPKEYDFSGYATKFNIECMDGAIIRDSAFKDCDGKRVPIVYNHNHQDNSTVLGHGILEYRENDGMYMYAELNETENGKNAKEQVRHGDLTNFSIYANHIRRNGADVIHGNIREVSLVLAGANPGAVIDSVMCHSDDDGFEEESAIIYSDASTIELYHADEDKKEEPKEEAKMADTKKEKTVADVLGDIKGKVTDDEYELIMGLIGAAYEQGGRKEKDEGESEDMKHNVFDNDAIQHDDNGNVYVSAETMQEAFAEAKQNGSLKKACISHGITDIDFLFPDYKNLDTPPQFIKRDTDWVSGVMSSVHKSPMSRIRSTFANITADDARARGYITGQQKVSEVFPLLKRQTDPQTVYKLQKFDRDDIIDITDFDVVNWVKGEMRMMLDEEIARAILVGDGREPGTDYAISHDHIRPIWTDADLYTIKVPVQIEQTATLGEIAKAQIQAIIRARKNYKGSGNPTFYTTEDVLTEMLLLEDKMGRIIYDSVDKLATALRVSKIVTVPVMENLTREVSGENRPLVGIIVNLVDYNVGADKGGAVNMFDDFDIDFNKYTYLIETRCSGALVKPYSAMAIEMDFQ